MTTPEKTPIWLDCDPGHDDTFAIILAAEHPSLELLGLSTVHGNSSLRNVTVNAHSVLTAIDRTNIPVYAGASKPFMRPAVHAPDIHGESGIDGTNLLPLVTVPAYSTSESAIIAMRDALLATPPNTAALVATGTLTNVALLFAAFPEVAKHIKVLSIMGGAFGTRPDARGNITKTAEFNIFCDPEAAQSVFSTPALSGKIILIPLDITHTCFAGPPVQERLLKDGTNLRKMLLELLNFFASTYERVFGLKEGPPLHDPIAVAAVIPTQQIGWEWEEVGVKVVCQDGEDLGRTVKLAPDSKEGRENELGEKGVETHVKVRVPKKVEVPAFWNVMLEAVEKADGRYEWPA